MNIKSLLSYNINALQSSLPHAKIHYYHEISSTIDYLNKDGQENLVLAEQQTQGRGQRNNTWKSYPYQQILMSYGPFWPESDINACSKEFYEILLKVLVKFNAKCTYKFPNDFYVNKKKICGVLFERYQEKNYLHLGLNVIMGAKSEYGELLNPEQINKDVLVRENIIKCIIESISSDLIIKSHT